MSANDWEGQPKRGNEKGKERNINPRTTSFFPIPARLELQKHSGGVQQSAFHRPSFAHVLTPRCLRDLLNQSVNSVYQSLLSTSLCGTRRSDSSFCDTRTHRHTHLCSLRLCVHTCSFLVYLTHHFVSLLVIYLITSKSRNSTPAGRASCISNIWKHKKTIVCRSDNCNLYRNHTTMVRYDFDKVIKFK